MRPSNMNRRQSGVEQPLEYEDMFEERVAVTNAKLVFLMLATFGLIAFIYFISWKIETMLGSTVVSYKAGGGFILALFIVYVTFWAIKWFFGAKKREDLKREAVEKQIAKQRAMQAMQNME